MRRMMLLILATLLLATFVGVGSAGANSPARPPATPAPATPPDTGNTSPTTSQPGGGSTEPVEGRGVTCIVGGAGNCIDDVAGAVTGSGDDDKTKSEIECGATDFGCKAMRSMAEAFASSTVWVLGSIDRKLGDSADPAFSGKGSSWFRAQYGTMFALALTITLVLTIIALGTAAMRGDQGAIPSILGHVLASILLTAAAVPLMALALQFSDAFTDVVMSDYHDNTTQLLTNMASTYSPSALNNNNLAITLLMALVTIVGALMIFVILLIRGALLYGVVLFLPFVFAGWVFPATRAMLPRAVKFIVMLVAIKFVMFAFLAAGAAGLAAVTGPPVKATSGKSVQTATKSTGAAASGKASSSKKKKDPNEASDNQLATGVFGIGAILMAAFSPWLVMSLLPFGAQNAASSVGSKVKGAIPSRAGPATPSGGIATSGGGQQMAMSAAGGAATAGAGMALSTVQRTASQTMAGAAAANQEGGTGVSPQSGAGGGGAGGASSGSAGGAAATQPLAVQTAAAGASGAGGGSPAPAGGAAAGPAYSSGASVSRAATTGASAGAPASSGSTGGGVTTSLGRSSSASTTAGSASTAALPKGVQSNRQVVTAGRGFNANSIQGV